MTEISSSWLVGSFVLASNATLVVNGNNRTVNAGTYYLRDATNSLSLIFEIQTEIAAEVPGSTVTIGKDRKLKITSGGAALTLGVPASLQEVLGLPASPTVGTTIAASSVSTLLWSPGWPETPHDHPYGKDGVDIDDLVITSSPTGLTTYFTTHHTVTLAEWSWQHVKQSRAWMSEVGGEYKVFFDDVLKVGRRFKLHSSMAEDEASSSDVTWVTALGPYVARELDFRWYKRAIANTDSNGAGWTLSAMITAEIT
jgi:hypothetical protein